MDEAPLPPPEQPQPGFWQRSATKAVIVSSVMGTFALGRALRARPPESDPWILVLDFLETMAGNWLSAWLGITAAGKSGR